MKRLIYLTYLGLLATMLISCEKEQILPADAAMAASLERKPTCQQYEYTTGDGYFNMGTAVGNEIIVGFNGNVSLKQQQQLLRRFREVKGLTSPMNSYSGLASFFELKAGTKCAEVEALIVNLEKLPEVRFVLPGLQLGTYTDEFLVTLDDPASEAALIQLTINTNTRIVADPIGTGFGAYMISAEKHSAGNMFEMLTVFSQASFIIGAEPNGPIFPI